SGVEDVLPQFSPRPVQNRVPNLKGPAIVDATAASVGKDVVTTESAIVNRCLKGVDTTAQTRPFGGAPEHRVAADRAIGDCSSTVNAASSARYVIFAAASSVVTDSAIGNCPTAKDTAAQPTGMIAINRAVGNCPTASDTATFPRVAWQLSYGRVAADGAVDDG